MVTRTSKDPSNFDLVIESNSLSNLIRRGDNRGWRISKSERGYNNYLKNKDKQFVSVSALGLAKTGKSYILSKLSNDSVFPGDSQKSLGISIKYPETEKQCNCIFIDNHPISTPLDLSTISKDVPYSSETEGKLFKDKLITEVLVQNFIQKISNMIIITVGQLTNAEELLIVRLKKLMDTRLIVVHNLRFLNTPEEMQVYIETQLQFVITLNLIKHEHSFKYYEKYKNKSEEVRECVHYFWGNDRCMAEFNNNTLTMIKDEIQQVIVKSKLDLLLQLQQYLVLVSQSYFSTALKAKDVVIDEDYIYIESGERLTLNTWKTDAFGNSWLWDSKSSWRYSYYINKEYTRLVFEVEVPAFDIENKKLTCFTDSGCYRFSFEFDAKYEDPDLNAEKEEEVTYIVSHKKTKTFRLVIWIDSNWMSIKKSKVWKQIRHFEPDEDAYENGIYRVVYRVKKRERKKKTTKHLETEEES